MFKSYKISMLFDWQNGNTDLKKEHINGKGIPVVSSGVENTGIIGCTDVDARILPAHTITVDMFGNVYYRDFEYKEVTHARVFTLIPKGFELDVQTGLYFVSSLKVLSKIYSYDNMCSYAKMSNMDISLPVIENPNPDHEYTADDIDWQYMRERIQELERERIQELERERIQELDAYLQATGLNDYELTEEDKKALSLTSNRASNENGTLEDNSEDEVRFGEFDVSDIYEVQKVQHKLDKSQIELKGNYPCFSSDTTNNGILGYTDNPEFHISNETKVYIIFGDHTRTFDIATTDFSVLDNVKVLKPVINNIKVLQYINSVWGKSIPNLGYARHWSVAKNKKISLPIKSDGTPDFDYMEKYIRAMEKVVIADVVKYKDKVIETTKEVVGRI